MATVLTEVNIFTVSNDGRIASYFGKAKEFQMPEVEHTKIEQKTVGGIGQLKYPVGVKFGNASFTINGFEKEAYRVVANPFSEFTIMVRGNLKEFNGETLIEETPVKAFVRATSNKFSQLGKFTGQENIEQTIDLDPTMTRLEQNGEVLSEIDISNHIWKVAGEDLLANAKKNMGLG